MPNRHRQSRGGLLTGALVVAMAGIVLWGWVRASPPGSSPDDDYHLASIWCAEGFVEGRCVDAGGELPLVPEKLIETGCYRRRTGESAACLDVVLARPDNILIPAASTLRFERADLYYRAAHRLVGDDVVASIQRIRVANAALVLVMVAATALVAGPSPVRTAVTTAWLVVSVPLGLFLVASVNSTAWGLAGLGTFWANVASATSHYAGHRRRIAAAALAVIGAVMAIGARTEALPHLVVSALAVAAIRLGDRDLSRRPIRAAVIALTALPALTIASLVLLPSGLLLDPLRNLASSRDVLVERGLGAPLVSLALEVPRYWTGGVGSLSLGWLDTPPPASTWTLTTVVLVGLATLGLRGASAGRVAAIVLLVVALVVFPTVALVSAASVVQEVYQARHFLPLLYVLLGIALLRERGGSTADLGRTGHVAFAVMLASAHAAALHLNIQRYATGLVEARYAPMRPDVEWWWATGAGPATTWAVGSAAFLAASLLVLDALRKYRGRQPGTANR